MPNSNLDIFKIGIGPSSSHTLGPLIAASRFLKELDQKQAAEAVCRVQCTFYGSLSLTGRGHLTDKAVLWGLSGLKPDAFLPQDQAKVLADAQAGVLKLGGRIKVPFDYRADVVFSKEFQKEHENALCLQAFDKQGRLLHEQMYFSTGGGFVQIRQELTAGEEQTGFALEDVIDIENTKKALLIAQDDDLNLAEMSFMYEEQFHERDYIVAYCTKIWEVMQKVYERGLNPSSAYLPGPLHLKRRAPNLHRHILKESDDPFVIMDNITLFAISIAEENAAGSQVVTAPTNGACAVIPAVMLYLKNYSKDFNDEKAVDFLMAAMLIGSFYKNNASISGAEAGCQAEIGSASSMAAAAMATVLGASAAVACSAAEVAMEHHLGLTCDPVDGLVQIPCIERNAFGAIKAITAARMSLSRTTAPRVGLDEVIKTMYLTGRDMNIKYKETSLGGLATTVGD